MFPCWNVTRRSSGDCCRLCESLEPYSFLSRLSFPSLEADLSVDVSFDRPSLSGAISTLAAPRIDYLSESVARRKAREEKIAEARALQVAFRNDPTSTPTRSPRSSASSSSSSPFLQPNPSEPTSAQASPLTFQTYEDQPTSSQPPDAFPLVARGTPRDFDMNEFLSSAGGGGDAMFGSMDFTTAENDPLMVRLAFGRSFVSRVVVTDSFSFLSLPLTFFVGALRRIASSSTTTTAAALSANPLLLFHHHGKPTLRSQHSESRRIRIHVARDLGWLGENEGGSVP